MIYSNRSFEHRSHAIRRDHLLPVERETDRSYRYFALIPLALFVIWSALHV